MEALGLRCRYRIRRLEIKVIGKGMGKGALGASVSQIQVSALSSVDFKEVTVLTNGHIELVTVNGKTLVHFRRK